MKPLLLVGLLWLTLSPEGVIAAPSRGETYAAALEHAQARYTAALVEVPVLTAYPRSILPTGNWRTVNASDWTSGFWPGNLWMLYAWTGDPFWKLAAESRQQGLASQQFNTSTHDLGFMLYNSFGWGYRLTGNSAFRSLLIQATASLMSRYNPTVGAIRSWSWGTWDDFPNFTVIVDNLMNLELPYAASTWPEGNVQWAEMASAHAETSASAHLRADSSTYHAVIFDERDGSIISRLTHQGFGDETTWARGQAWGIYGFTLAYRFTGNSCFLERAQALADWFLQSTAVFPIPPWDFSFLNSPYPVPYDSSAAAIAAAALLELAQYVSESDKTRYCQEAFQILDVLAQPPFLTVDSAMRTVLDHATGNWPANDEIDTGILYGDYYFIEALLRYFSSFGGGSYAYWAGSQFGFPQRGNPGTGSQDDPNHDGIPNIWHYLTNTPALGSLSTQQRARLPTVAISSEGNARTLLLSTTIVEFHPDVHLKLEVFDPASRTWSPVETTPSTTPGDTGLQQLTWTLPLLLNGPTIVRVNAFTALPAGQTPQESE